jgi:hypothetical protein
VSEEDISVNLWAETDQYKRKDGSYSKGIDSLIARYQVELASLKSTLYFSRRAHTHPSHLEFCAQCGIPHVCLPTFAYTGWDEITREAHRRVYQEQFGPEPTEASA